MIVETIVVGPLQANCYVIGDEKTGRAMVIDPGGEPEMIMDAIRRCNLTVDYVICTHGHFDHVGAVGALKRETGAKVVLHETELELYNSAPALARYFGLVLDAQPAPDLFIKGGDAVNVGTLSFAIFESPGHSPGGIFLYGEGLVITGDTLFAGSIGRTDLPGGDESIIRKSLGKLMSLPAGTLVLPGHGPSSTIGAEKRENPFVNLFELAGSDNN